MVRKRMWEMVPLFLSCPSHGSGPDSWSSEIKQETWVRSVGKEDPLEKETTTHSSILTWEIPWTEEPEGLQSTGLQRVGPNWATNTHTTQIQPGFSHRSSCCLKQKRGKAAADKEVKQRQPTQVSSHWPQFCNRLFVFLIQNNKNARFAFIVCPLMPGYILQDFTSVLKHSSRSASLRRRRQEVGGGGRGERRQGDAHPTSKGPAQLQPCETPPHELIPWQCKLGWHNASGKLLQPTAVGALLLFQSTGKISIGISSCSWGNGILFRGVVGNRTPCLR